MTSTQLMPQTRTSTTSLTPTLAVILAGAVGVGNSLQGPVTSTLMHSLGSILFTAWLVFATGLLMTGAVLVARPASRASFQRVPLWRTPRWTYGAGVSSAVSVIAIAVSVPTIGVAAATVAMSAGQLAFGLFVDKYGLSGSGARSITPLRIAACALAVASLGVAQAQQLRVENFMIVLLMFGAGALSIVQNAAMARMNTASEDITSATIVTQIGGLMAVTFAIAVAGFFQVLSLPEPVTSWPTDVWVYTGGFLNTVVITCIALSVSVVGVVRMSLIARAVQLSTGIALDIVFFSQVPVGMFTVLGVVGVFSAAVLGSRNTAVTR